MTSDISFPTLSRSTSLSPSSPTALASGQGEEIASGRAHSHSHRVHLDHLYVVESYIHDESACRHARLNLTDGAIAKNQSCF